MGMLVMLGMSAYAEDIIWQEDWSGVTDVKIDPASFNSNYTFTGTVLNEDGTPKSGTMFYSQNLAGGTAPELLIAKNGGSFAAKVSLGGKSGEMTLAFKANKNLTVTVEGATLGEAAITGNDYLYPVTVAAGTTELTITFTQTGSSNVRLDNIKLYQGTAKKPAGLSWGKASTTLTIGEEITLTLSNANQLPVTYSSSEESVATINAEGVITLVAAGKTVLTAAFAGNDEYEAQSVSIEVTVKAGGDNPDPDPEIAKITVNTALQLIAELEDGKTTDKEYQVEGYVIAVSEISTQYGNATFTIADAANGTDVLTVFRVKGFNGESITNANLLKAGDLVVVQGKLQKYVKNEVTSPQLAQGGKIVSINGKTSDDTPTPEITKITVNTALQLIAELESGKTTDQEYQVEGYVTAIDEISTQYGNATFDIADAQGGTPVLKVYRAKNAVGDKITDENLFKVGDLVVVQGKLQKFVKNEVTTPELASGGKILTVNGIATGITEVGNSRLQKDVIYNLRGQRVSVAKNGLYIINGKKVFVK